MSEKLKRKADWEGRYVTLNNDIVTNGGAIFKRGEVMLVEKNYGGLHLRTTRNCKECGQQFRKWVVKIPEWNVELLSKSYIPEEHTSRSDFLQSELAIANAEIERLRGIIRKVENLSYGWVSGESRNCCDSHPGEEHESDCSFYQWETSHE